MDKTETRTALVRELEKVCEENCISILHKTNLIDGDIFYNPEKSIVIIGDTTTEQKVNDFKNIVVENARFASSSTG